MAKERELRPYNFEPKISDRKATRREAEVEEEGSDDGNSMETDGSAGAGTRGRSRSRPSSTVNSDSQSQRQSQSQRSNRLEDLDLSWCTCGNCGLMLREIECVCCKEIAAVTEFLDMESADQNCITNSFDFKSCCLTKSVLEVTQVMQRHCRGYVAPLDVMEKRMYRFMAYKSFTALIHKSLGKGNRRVIPACAVVQIHNSFPETTGVYTGFKFGKVVSEHHSEMD